VSPSIQWPILVLAVVVFVAFVIVDTGPLRKARREAKERAAATREAKGAGSGTAGVIGCGVVMFAAIAAAVVGGAYLVIRFIHWAWSTPMP
jgi:hypothetical protein